MREILFRGKRISGGFWLFGDLRQWSETRKGIFDNSIKQTNEVDPATVGQFTGLCDKNGTRIFEGDILVFCKGATHPILVYWDGLGWKFLRNRKRIVDAFECNTIDHIRSCEVIGNIHDNREFLERGTTL